jgi:hypothetical protein
MQICILKKGFTSLPLHPLGLRLATAPVPPVEPGFSGAALKFQAAKWRNSADTGNISGRFQSFAEGSFLETPNAKDARIAFRTRKDPRL